MTAPTPSLLDPEVANDPYPYYAHLRRDAPVTRLDALGVWLVARYDDVVRILRDPETFSSVVGTRQLAGEDLSPSMIFNDPPVHTRLRGMIAKAFTSRVVERQRAAIEARSRELVTAMLARDEADIVLDLAYPLPVMVIAHMLGVADGDHATFKRWSDAIIENVAPILLTGDDSVLTDTNREFDAYFRRRLDQLRRVPEDNLLGELLRVETDEGRLTETELLMFCRLLLVAGNETTTGLIVNAIRVFAEAPRGSRAGPLGSRPCFRTPSRRRCATTRPSRPRSAGRRGTSRSPDSRFRPERGCSSCSPPRTATRPPSSDPTSSCSTASRTATSPSAWESTTASEPHSLGSRPTSPFASCYRASAAWRSSARRTRRCCVRAGRDPSACGSSAARRDPRHAERTCRDPGPSPLTYSQASTRTGTNRSAARTHAR